MPMKKGENTHKKIYDIIREYHNQDDFTTITTEEIGKRTQKVDEKLKKEAQEIIDNEMKEK